MKKFYFHDDENTFPRRFNRFFGLFMEPSLLAIAIVVLLFFLPLVIWASFFVSLGDLSLPDKEGEMFI